MSKLTDPGNLLVSQNMERLVEIMVSTLDRMDNQPDQSESEIRVGVDLPKPLDVIVIPSTGEES